MMIASLLFAAITTMAAPTSEIPAKRNYPVNEAINPCVNLYEHACSKTIENFKLREDRKIHIFAFSDSAERILAAKWKTLADLIKTETSDPIALELKNYYLSCIDKDSRSKEEKAFVQKLFADQKIITTKAQWLKKQAERIHSGNSGFIGYWGGSNFDDPTKTDLFLSPGYSFLPEKSYAKNLELVSSLEAFVTDFFKTIGADSPEMRAKTVMKYELSQQEQRLLPVESRSAYSQRKFTTKKTLIKKFPELQLKIFLSQIPDKTKIRELNPKTIPFLNEVAKTYSLDELKSLEMFYELSPRLDMGYPKYYDQVFAFKNKFLGGKNKRSVLEEECTEHVKERFGPELDYLVLPKMFPNFSSEKIAELVEQIRKSIIASLQKNKWLSNKARSEAMKKIETAYMRLVAPKTFEEWKFPETVEYKKDAYIENALKRDDVYEKKDFKYFKEAKDIRSWEGVEPLTVNAFYQSSYNQFTMLQGILQYPFYDQGNSLTENLAGIGMVVGHELGHGIDDQGSKYSADGRLHEWMTTADLKKFKELTRPLIEQYAAAGMNGEYTLGENIGDLVGLTAAYDAAFKDSSLTPEELKKEKQKFFLSYARSWCEVQLPGMKELRLKSDPHSLGIARVNEVVKHFAGFSESFDCKESDPMVLPAYKRIHIW